MLRYTGLCLGGLLLAAGLLGANPAEARGRRGIQWDRRYFHGPPYGYAYGYRANRAHRARFPRRFSRARIAGFGSTHGRRRVPGFGMNHRPSRVLGDRVIYRRRPEFGVIYRRRPEFGVNYHRHRATVTRRVRRGRVPGFGTNTHRTR